MENEIIKDLSFFKDKLYNGIFGDKIGCFDVAIKALEEIQQYRAIGTVEECREAMGRQMGKKQKPIKTPDCSDCEKECNQNCISFNYGETYLCPTCHQNAIFNSEYDMFYKFCPECGQAIDWSE